ncbi:MAG TPA: hypothetical protein VKP64_02635 [Mycobacteriales bacterium]|nr:hypothetical protein [Mycobacteriales bacterium]
MSLAALGPPFEVLLARLVDDAALLCAPDRSRGSGIGPVLAAHTAHRRAAYGELVGALRCPASRLGALTSALPRDQTLDIGVVLDTGLDTGADGLSALTAALDDPRVTLAVVEVRLPDEGDLAATATEYASALARFPSYVEVPAVPGWEAALDALAHTAANAVVRTGGLPTGPSPGVDEVGSFVRGCIDRQLAFTCTGGLERAVREADESGPRHGFLNLLAATAAALDGAEPDELAELLDSRDGAALVTRLRAVGGPEAEVTRGFFRSFGSCSLDAAIADLRALGVLR